MAYCSHCRIQVASRYCSSCGQLADAQSAVIDVARSVELVDHPPANIARGPISNPSGYVAPMAGRPAPSMGSTDTNRFTKNADAMLRSTGELMAWEGKPSQVMLLPPAALWTAVLLVAIIWAFQIHGGWVWVLFWLAFAAVHLGREFLTWLHTRYRITSQRLEYTSGVFSSRTVATPLSSIGDVIIHRPFPLNLFGFGNIDLDLPDRTRLQQGGHPRLRLRCIRDLECVRDLIHSSSNITGQVWDNYRFGR